jgi:Domain of unknown function (DUF4293)
MIQRIQSIFLLLSAGAAFGLFALPFAASSERVAASALFADGVYSITDHIGLLLFFALAGALALVSIFLFKKRPVQMKLCRFAIVADLLGLVFALVLFFSDRSTLSGVEAGIGIGLFLPVGFLIFGILALKYIRKDENLVQSMSRLR